jgi:hypothetical protein
MQLAVDAAIVIIYTGYTVTSAVDSAHFWKYDLNFVHQIGNQGRIVC